MAPRYFEWVDNMHDWCISRQLWWGHRIPVWYGPTARPCASARRGAAGRLGWTGRGRARHLVLLGAVAVLDDGLAGRHPDCAALLSDVVLVTGYDIIFFWVARMMMFGLYAMDGQPPFRPCCCTGLVRDSPGKKMSKSRGNVVDPLRVDRRVRRRRAALSLLQGANPGADQAINEEWVVGARNFCTKLWNATRFAC
jgi:valyl-tRNA synthetase